MRELTVRIRFTKHCLGDVKGKSGDFHFPRSPQGSVVFLSSWHHANMRFAAQIFGRHQSEVSKIHWDILVDGQLRADCWYRRYYKAGRRYRYSMHEAFFPGEIAGLNCVVPAGVPDDDFWSLMALVGRYRGISPWKPNEFGFFEVVSIRPRRAVPEESVIEAGVETERAV